MFYLDLQLTLIFYLVDWFLVFKLSYFLHLTSKVGSQTHRPIKRALLFTDVCMKLFIAFSMLTLIAFQDHNLFILLKY